MIQGVWLETAMKLPQLEYLIFYPTYQRYPTLHNGQFCYVREIQDRFDPIREIDDFAMRRIEKLKARRVVPFRIAVMSLTSGP
jgi:hypothetical protein